MAYHLLVTWLGFGIFSLIGLSQQDTADWRLEVEPRYLQVRRGSPVTLTCTLSDGAGGRVPLAGCGFRHHESRAFWNIGTGSATINNTIGGRATSALITSNTGQSGRCSLKIEGLPEWLSPYILGCRVRPVTGAWRYAAMMVVVNGRSPQQYRLQPPGVLVSLPGSDVMVNGLAEHGVDGCYFILPPFITEIYLRSATSENTTEYRAWKEGRRCGVTLLGVKPEQSGFVKSLVRSLSPNRYSADFVELLVAKAPESPPLLTLDSEHFHAGDILSATCIVTNSTPVSNITWLLGGDVIREDRVNEGPAESAWRWSYEPQTILQRLSHRLSDDDHGKVLTCQAGHLALPGGFKNSNSFTIQFKDACSPSPCGPHSQCSAHGSFATCSCQPPYIGQPPFCRPECFISSDCPLDKACVDQTCQDPCPRTGCGQDAVCHVVSHVPTCRCPVNFRGDPKTLCEPINPCTPNPCGPNSVCHDTGKYIRCSCLPRHTGSTPHCRPECVGNADCPEGKACVESVCEDVCPGDCGINALCRVISHASLCECPEGFSGDPHTRCEEEQCGRRNTFIALIAGGNNAIKGEFPWHVAVFEVLGDGTHKALCGGTLIKQDIVVTAAHCVFDDGHTTLRNSTTVKVVLGKLLREWDDDLGDPDVQRLDVDSMHVQEYYIGFHHDFRQDIALIKLSINATLGREVNVACVDWANTFGRVQLRTGSIGTVAGWGLTSNSNKVSPTLKWLDLPWVDPLTCRRQIQSESRRFLTNDKFCAGYLNRGRSVCQGDSGGGLLFLNETNNRYYLRGVVSTSLAYNTQPSLCHADHYTAFTSVGDYIDWIKQQLKELSSISSRRFIFMYK